MTFQSLPLNGGVYFLNTNSGLGQKDAAEMMLCQYQAWAQEPLLSNLAFAITSWMSTGWPAGGRDTRLPSPDHGVRPSTASQPHPSHQMITGPWEIQSGLGRSGLKQQNHSPAPEIHEKWQVSGLVPSNVDRFFFSEQWLTDIPPAVLAGIK